MTDRNKAIKISITSIFVYYILTLFRNVVPDLSPMIRFFYVKDIEWVVLIVMNIIALMYAFSNNN